MSFELTDLSRLPEAGFDAIIDVRSPSEFAEDHLPGAISLPVLSDQERARVGTMYVQDSPFKARKLGAALVARNAACHLEGPLAAYDGGWRPLVYCWRGGQRSASFASILNEIGWRVQTFSGGYRAYRRMVVNSLYDRDFPAPIVLLDGNTGTAKTEILRLLSEQGVQTLDLEGLANHRGSALGGQGTQPSQKGFESALAMATSRLDPERPVVVEAESSRIGRLNLPPRLFAAMRAAPRIEIEAPIGARAAYLCRAYADLVADTDLLVERLTRLVRLQGHARVAAWETMARAGDHMGLAEELIRHHYDPRYAKVRARRDVRTTSLSARALDEDGIASVATAVAAKVGMF